jgi:hypothetical protein
VSHCDISPDGENPLTGDTTRLALGLLYRRVIDRDKRHAFLKSRPPGEAGWSGYLDLDEEVRMMEEQVSQAD